MNNQTEFQRLHFFTGLFTTADDWLAEQIYHLEKRRLHLGGLHSPGILAGQGEEFLVTTAGGMAVRVASGAALDRAGNLIYLPSATELAVPTPDPLPATVYVVVEFAEKRTDFRLNPEDADYSGWARMSELPRLGCTDVAPDNQMILELARIDLHPGVTGIVDPRDPAQPGANEIDFRFRTRAGAVDQATDDMLTAVDERLQRVHRYHLEQQQRHNRGLFKPGIMRGMLNELHVTPAGGLTVHVKPGVALDGEGRELYLDETVPVTFEAPVATTRFYVAARYQDGFASYLADHRQPFAGSYRTAQVAVVTAKPDSQTWLELASVDLEAGATEVRPPADPGNPQPNELDRRGVEWAAALAVVAPKLPTALRERIAHLMSDKRRGFAALSARFPVPSAGDVRQAALNLETLARNDSLKGENLTEVLTMLAALEQDVGQEIGAAYPPTVGKPEYEDYVAAVVALRQALYAGEPIDVVLNCQATITMAARELAEVIFQAPSADAGPDQAVTSADDEATVTLDASGSQAFDDQRIVTYRWEKEQ
jgi:hypothetical protein